MTKEILIKFLNDQCSERELAEVIRWIKSESLSNRSSNWGLEDWNSFQGEEQYLNKNESDSLLDKIHHKINVSSKYRFHKSGGARFIRRLTTAAAILLLPVLGMLYYSLTKSPQEATQYVGSKVDSLEIITPVGSRTVVQLPDGTEVYLNHGSILKYPQNFIGATRGVTLSGEGYFKVTHDPEMPFVVQTPFIHVTALGTEFNISAYPDENTIETTLVKGKVALEQKTPERKLRSLGTIIPGQHVEYLTETKKIISTIGDVEPYIGWKDGRLIFKNESIVHIADKLGRWYNVEFEFKNEAAKQFTYTATFVDETLLQILDLLKIATPIDYKILPRKKQPDGTFSKQKIIINNRL